MTAHDLVPEKLVIIDMGVGGMTCDDCVDHVTEALESVPGVSSAKVDFEARSATIKATGDVPSEALSGAVRERGYNAFERQRSNG
ncbi:MAG: cation transporter [Chloroflexota bacterium]